MFATLQRFFSIYKEYYYGYFHLIVLHLLRAKWISEYVRLEWKGLNSETKIGRGDFPMSVYTNY